MSLVTIVQGWRRHIVTSSPYKDLVLAVLGCRLRFVETLKRTVVSLIEAPVLDMVDPVEVKLVRDGVPCLDGPLQDGRVAGVEEEAVFLEHLACLDGL